MFSFLQVDRHPGYKKIIAPLAAEIHQHESPKGFILKNEYAPSAPPSFDEIPAAITQPKEKEEDTEILALKARIAELEKVEAENNLLKERITELEEDVEYLQSKELDKGKAPARKQTCDMKTETDDKLWIDFLGNQIGEATKKMLLSYPREQPSEKSTPSIAGPSEKRLNL